MFEPIHRRPRPALRFAHRLPTRLGARPAPLCVAVLGATLLSACNIGGGGETSEPQAPPGSFAEKPDGSGSYISEPAYAPDASRLGLAGLYWGRLVDLHDLEADGSTAVEPRFTDLVVRQELGTNGADYRLEVDALTQEERLVVLRDAEDPAQRADFEALVLEAATDLPLVDPKDDGPLGVPPFSIVPCNAAFVLVFDDLLEDRLAASVALDQLVQVRTGYTPVEPFSARVFFGRSFGGVAEDSFRPTRIVIDTTVSELEAQESGLALPNAFGLPASLANSDAANVSLRIPTRVQETIGQFAVLTNLRGRPLDVQANGPADEGAATMPVVRAARSGNAGEPERGFLLDDVPPRLLGSWAATLDAVRPVIGGGPRDVRVDLTFTSACLRAPLRGDLLRTDEVPLQVLADGAEPDAAGRLLDLPARLLLPLEGTDLGGLLGPMDYLSTFGVGEAVPDACWVRFLPDPGTVPGTEIDPGATVQLEFSEPLDPEGPRALDGPLLVRGDEQPEATTIAPRLVRAGASLRVLDLLPLVDLPHVEGVAEEWRVALGELERPLTDLAGNPLIAQPDSVPFTLAPEAASVDSAGFVLRFREPDEYRDQDTVEGASDLRGQIGYDPERGVLVPRSVQRRSWSVDQSQLLPSLMLPLPVPIPEPLSPLGSRLQTLWRYADLGWSILDETLVDLDVEGLALAPFSGGVVADFFEEFEIRLGHASRLPDESIAANALLFPASGLLSAPSEFDVNIAGGAAEGSEVVHPRSLGYFVDPTAVYRGASGTSLVPLPLNQDDDQDRRTFTWRDTSVLDRGGLNGPGLPLSIEIEQGLYPDLSPGELAAPGEVPTIGLPLLMEFSAFPSNTALGLNGFQVAIARSGQLFPTWRVHTTGGFDVTGGAVFRNPDLSPIPIGGFDAAGAPTRPNDPSLYYGELNTVVRVSRAHSVWFDGGAADVRWNLPLQIPRAVDQPGSTAVTLAFRGASGFVATDGAEVDAARLDVYGDVDLGQVLFAGTDGGWVDDPGDLGAARYLQVRITFENDLDANLSPILNALALTAER